MSTGLRRSPPRPPPTRWLCSIWIRFAPCARVPCSRCRAGYCASAQRAARAAGVVLGREHVTEPGAHADPHVAVAQRALSELGERDAYTVGARPVERLDAARERAAVAVVDVDARQPRLRCLDADGDAAQPARRARVL